jgi:hypothetical protein
MHDLSSLRKKVERFRFLARPHRASAATDRSKWFAPAERSSASKRWLGTHLLGRDADFAHPLSRPGWRPADQTRASGTRVHSGKLTKCCAQFRYTPPGFTRILRAIAKRFSRIRQRFGGLCMREDQAALRKRAAGCIFEGVWIRVPAPGARTRFGASGPGTRSAQRSPAR